MAAQLEFTRFGIHFPYVKLVTEEFGEKLGGDLFSHLFRR